MLGMAGLGWYHGKAKAPMLFNPGVRCLARRSLGPIGHYHRVRNTPVLFHCGMQHPGGGNHRHNNFRTGESSLAGDSSLTDKPPKFLACGGQ